MLAVYIRGWEAAGEESAAPLQTSRVRLDILRCCVCATETDGPARVLTSKRWELTFLPFFIQVILGFGSPVAWHTNDATPPETPVWSSGDLTKLGKPDRGGAKWAEGDVGVVGGVIKNRKEG